MSNQEYGNESIRKLSDREAVRTRVSVYAGSADRDGAFTTVKEIISNSIDEFKAGHGKEIRIKYNSDNSIVVSDNGRGIPMDWNEGEKDYNYNLLLFTLNAGGKYDSNNYEFSIGLNGIGSSLATMSSEMAEITSVRDGYVYHIKSSKGQVVGELSKKKNKENLPNGTTVIWKPDKDVFDEIDFPDSWFKEYIKRQSIVNKGLKLIFENSNGEKFIEYYENGIIDYAEEINKDEGFTSNQYFETGDIWGKDRNDRDEYKTKYEVSYVFNNENPTMESYHNSSYLSEGGSPHDAIKSAFVYEIDRLIKKMDKYNKNEKKVSFDDIKESLIIITNTYSTETAYKNQTKLAISNKFIKDKLNEILRQHLHVYLLENPIEAERVCNQVLANKRSREKAEKTRLDVRKKLSGKVNNISNRVEGFIDCRAKDPKDKEFFIVEGKSALGAILQGRDSKYQAIFPIRGKILSSLKASNKKIFANDVITNIYKILGCGVELREGKKKDSTFNMESLNYDKIVICTDQDVDGMSIRSLLLTMFYVLSPQLIEEGKIYIVDSPLYEILDIETDIMYYAYNDKDRDDLIREKKLSNYSLSRNKGLGELDSEVVSETLMKPDTRKLTQITVNDIDSMEKYFDLFMGSKVEPRRDFIVENFDKYEFEI